MGAFLGRSWRDRRAALGRVFEALPIVREKRAQKARTLSGGERRLVGLGRGMMRPARLMLIDEPSLGLAPVAIEAVYAALASLREESDAAVILIEENFTHIGGIADVVHVLEAGTIVRSGSYAELSADRTVVETYLGALPEAGQ
jgi:branched-chain amino acid transport system ATP-binding protein